MCLDYGLPTARNCFKYPIAALSCLLENPCLPPSNGKNDTVPAPSFFPLLNIFHFHHRFRILADRILKSHKAMAYNSDWQTVPLGPVLCSPDGKVVSLACKRAFDNLSLHLIRMERHIIPP